MPNQPSDDPAATIRALLDQATAMNPDDYRTGQDHLPPAFRQVDFRAAFLALVELWNQLEVEVLTLLDAPKDQAAPRD